MVTDEGMQLSPRRVTRSTGLNPLPSTIPSLSPRTRVSASKWHGLLAGESIFGVILMRWQLRTYYAVVNTVAKKHYR